MRFRVLWLVSGASKNRTCDLSIIREPKRIPGDPSQSPWVPIGPAQKAAGRAS
jgi:hypothetical protein